MKGLLCIDRVSVYIAEGRAGKIVDADQGVNVTTKIEKLQRKGGTEQVHPNLAKVPKCPAADAPGWTSNLSKLPCFTFRTILLHLTNVQRWRSTRGSAVQLMPMILKKPGRRWKIAAEQSLNGHQPLSAPASLGYPRPRQRVSCFSESGMSKASGCRRCLNVTTTRRCAM